uniref:NADH-ubiquinone oxidoreductase chain 6 n=1 Tax=Sphaerothecum destruens TaxID=42893 RepID=A0A6H2U2B2_9EUKA|nr:NADH dehydrogenase subunit 6 [Sphaerothecum destruens]QID02690.1 NADH dehydrogenase subunit 6 [Sphaerothecum destruens]
MLLLLDLFFVFNTLLASLMVILVGNPVYSVLYLILCFLNVSCLFFILGLEFVSIMMLIVYVGAIAVLFLFVIMMLDIRLGELEDNLFRFLPVGLLFGILFFVVIYVLLFSSLLPISKVLTQFVVWLDLLIVLDNVSLLGLYLFNMYWFVFIGLGYLLMVAIIGVIILCIVKIGKLRKQDIYFQVIKGLKTSIKVLY